MKRAISLLIALVMCLGLAVPAFAAEFVPSITGKDAPEIVPIEDDDGNEAIGTIEQNGDIIDYVYGDCLVITPVSEATTSTLIPDDAEELLLDVYEQLSDGSMELPYNKISSDLDPDDMVIKDLFDVSWLCEEHPPIVAQEGVTVTLIFDLGVDKDTTVYCMTYMNNAWDPVVSCVNNGDGTVTVVFEDFCPVVFAVEKETPPASTGDNSNVHVWMIVMAVSVVALGAVLVLSHRKVAR